MRKFASLSALAITMALAVPAAAQVRNLMTYADGDGDGAVSEREFEEFSMMAWDRSTGRADRMLFTALDERIQQQCRRSAVDDDGYISREAFRHTSLTRFHRLDRNGDGRLNDAELNQRTSLAGL